MNVSAWSIRNPIPAAMLFVMLTLAGLFSFQAMKVQNFPDLDVPNITTVASLPVTTSRRALPLGLRAVGSPAGSNTLAAARLGDGVPGCGRFCAAAPLKDTANIPIQNFTHSLPPVYVFSCAACPSRQRPESSTALLSPWP